MLSLGTSIPPCARAEMSANYFPKNPASVPNVVTPSRKVVGVTIEVRSHGNAERGRGAGCKSWLLKNVIFTLATDPPTPAPTQQ